MTTTDACSSLEASSKTSQPIEQDDNRLLNFKIKKLKSKLINEEHRLVLMKKIRQSQTRPINQQQQQQQQLQQQQQVATPMLHQQRNAASPMGSGSGTPLGQTTGNPSKKLRPSLLSSPSSGIGNVTNPALALQKSFQSTSSNSSPQNPLAMNQTPAHAHQRTKINTLWNPPPQQARQPTPAGLAPAHVGNLSRQPITTPPNVVHAMMGGLNPGQQSLLMNQINALTGGAPMPAALNNSGSRRSMNVGSMSRQPITTPPNIVQGGSMSSQQLPKSSRRAHSGNSSRLPITTPPNVVHDVRSPLAGQQSLLMNANSLSSSSSSSRSRQQAQPNILQQQSSFSKSQAAHVLLQKRTAAKNAIQKQLEQTLLQLPQKHIQMGIDFIPNANNIEFVYYIGLEACVDYLTHTKNPLDAEPIEKPYECSTCGTDFTPSWSWKRANVVCENCVGNHVKKSIKNSQANRIKSILAKAAKQESDMDKRIMAEAASVVSNPSTPTTSNNQQRHSLLQPTTPSQRSTPQTPSWPRTNASPLAAVNRSSTSLTNTTQTTAANVQSALNNPLAALPPAALASLLQMNPQFSTLASLMTANTAAPNNTNQLTQIATLLMNQMTMNLWNNNKR